MSNDCRDQVYRRQKLGWQDYKASGVVISCRNEIKKYKCRRGVETSDKHVRLSQILLCLENEFHKGQDINGDCIEEIKMHRKSLMDDHSLTPELLTACAIDKQKFCANKGIHGKTLHCLMAHAQIREHAKRLQPPCMAEVSCTFTFNQTLCFQLFVDFVYQTFLVD
jgi:Golgi apparatus protein 1